MPKHEISDLALMLMSVFFTVFFCILVCMYAYNSTEMVFDLDEQNIYKELEEMREDIKRE